MVFKQFNILDEREIGYWEFSMELPKGSRIISVSNCGDWPRFDVLATEEELETRKFIVLEHNNRNRKLGENFSKYPFIGRTHMPQRGGVDLFIFEKIE